MSTSRPRCLFFLSSLMKQTEGLVGHPLNVPGLLAYGSFTSHRSELATCGRKKGRVIDSKQMQEVTRITLNVPDSKAASFHNCNVI